MTNKKGHTKQQQLVIRREQAEKVLELRKRGLPVLSIGKALNPPVSRARVYQCFAWLKENGYEVPAPTYKRKYKRKYDSLDEQRVIEAWPEDGICQITKLAKDLGVSVYFVGRVRDVNNLPYRPDIGNKIPVKDQMVLWEKYSQGSTILELSKEHQVTRAAVSSLFTRLDRKGLIEFKGKYKTGKTC
jgi:hypothetical protein